MGVEEINKSIKIRKIIWVKIEFQILP
jgi:hypothetical protein